MSGPSDAPFDPDPSDALALLAACPVHAPTPLLSLPSLAASHGWAALDVKDETGRMGLGSFKALGGAYAVADLVRAQLRRTLGREPAPRELTLPREADLVVACASAGNHGLALAAGARVFGARAVVYLADTVPEPFADRLRGLGAQVVRAGTVYDEAMATAARDAAERRWHLVSDSSWPGYRAIPSTIMRGYCVMAAEMAETFAARGIWPTHVFLQAGVGGLAAAVAAHIRAHWHEQPRIAVVEPEAAPCLRDSIRAGRPVRVEGPVSTMGRLDCKEPSLVAFEVLREAADECITVSDAAAAQAAKRLEPHAPTTPSGAAGLAGALAADLAGDARVLVIASEGPG